MQRIFWLIVVMWAGSLWTVCGIVAPSLFRVMPDRHLAGQVAGEFFRIESWLGLALGIAALILLMRGAVTQVKRFDFALVAVAILGPVTSELALRPMMDAARSASDMSRFGMLHGLSALLFAVACLSLLVLVWRLSSTKV